MLQDGQRDNLPLNVFTVCFNYMADERYNFAIIEKIA